MAWGKIQNLSKWAQVQGSQGKGRNETCNKLTNTKGSSDLNTTSQFYSNPGRERKTPVMSWPDIVSGHRVFVCHDKPKVTDITLKLLKPKPPFSLNPTKNSPNHGCRVKDSEKSDGKICLDFSFSFTSKSHKLETMLALANLQTLTWWWYCTECKRFSKATIIKSFTEGNMIVSAKVRDHSMVFGLLHSKPQIWTSWLH